MVKTPRGPSPTVIRFGDSSKTNLNEEAAKALVEDDPSKSDEKESASKIEVAENPKNEPYKHTRRTPATPSKPNTNPANSNPTNSKSQTTNGLEKPPGQAKPDRSPRSKPVVSERQQAAIDRLTTGKKADVKLDFGPGLDTIDREKKKAAEVKKKQIEEEKKRQAAEVARLKRLEDQKQRESAEQERKTKLEEEKRRKAAELVRLKQIEQKQREATERERQNKIEEDNKRRADKLAEEKRKTNELAAKLAEQEQKSAELSALLAEKERKATELAEKLAEQEREAAEKLTNAASEANTTPPADSTTTPSTTDHSKVDSTSSTEHSSKEINNLSNDLGLSTSNQSASTPHSVLAEPNPETPWQTPRSKAKDEERLIDPALARKKAAEEARKRIIEENKRKEARAEAKRKIERIKKRKSKSKKKVYPSPTSYDKQEPLQAKEEPKPTTVITPQVKRETLNRVLHREVTSIDLPSEKSPSSDTSNSRVKVAWQSTESAPAESSPPKQDPSPPPSTYHVNPTESLEEELEVAIQHAASLHRAAVAKQAPALQEAAAREKKEKFDAEQKAIQAEQQAIREAAEKTRREHEEAEAARKKAAADSAAQKLKAAAWAKAVSQAAVKDEEPQSASPPNPAPKAKPKFGAGLAAIMKRKKAEEDLKQAEQDAKIAAWPPQEQLRYLLKQAKSKEDAQKIAKEFIAKQKQMEAAGRNPVLEAAQKTELMMKKLREAHHQADQEEANVLLEEKKMRENQERLKRGLPPKWDSGTSPKDDTPPENISEPFHQGSVITINTMSTSAPAQSLPQKSEKAKGKNLAKLVVASRKSDNQSIMTLDQAPKQPKRVIMEESEDELIGGEGKVDTPRAESRFSIQSDNWDEIIAKREKRKAKQDPKVSIKDKTSFKLKDPATFNKSNLKVKTNRRVFKFKALTPDPDTDTEDRDDDDGPPSFWRWLRQPAGIGRVKALVTVSRWFAEIHEKHEKLKVEADKQKAEAKKQEALQKKEQKKQEALQKKEQKKQQELEAKRLEEQKLKDFVAKRKAEAATKNNGGKPENKLEEIKEDPPKPPTLDLATFDTDSEDEEKAKKKPSKKKKKEGLKPAEGDVSLKQDDNSASITTKPEPEVDTPGLPKEETTLESYPTDPKKKKKKKKRLKNVSDVMDYDELLGLEKQKAEAAKLAAQSQAQATVDAVKQLEEPTPVQHIAVSHISIPDATPDTPDLWRRPSSTASVASADIETPSTSRPNTAISVPEGIPGTPTVESDQETKDTVIKKEEKPKGKQTETKPAAKRQVAQKTIGAKPVKKQEKLKPVSKNLKADQSQPKVSEGKAKEIVQSTQFATEPSESSTDKTTEIKAVNPTETSGKDSTPESKKSTTASPKKETPEAVITAPDIKDDPKKSGLKVDKSTSRQPATKPKAGVKQKSEGLKTPAYKPATKPVATAKTKVTPSKKVVPKPDSEPEKKSEEIKQPDFKTLEETPPTTVKKPTNLSLVKQKSPAVEPKEVTSKPDVLKSTNKKQGKIVETKKTAATPPIQPTEPKQPSIETIKPKSIIKAIPISSNTKKKGKGKKEIKKKELSIVVEEVERPERRDGEKEEPTAATLQTLSPNKSILSNSSPNSPKAPRRSVSFTRSKSVSFIDPDEEETPSKSDLKTTRPISISTTELKNSELNGPRTQQSQESVSQPPEISAPPVKPSSAQSKDAIDAVLGVNKASSFHETDSEEEDDENVPAHLKLLSSKDPSDLQSSKKAAFSIYDVFNLKQHLPKRKPPPPPLTPDIEDTLSIDSVPAFSDPESPDYSRPPSPPSRPPSVASCRVESPDYIRRETPPPSVASFRVESPDYERPDTRPPSVASYRDGPCTPVYDRVSTPPPSIGSPNDYLTPLNTPPPTPPPSIGDPEENRTPAGSPPRSPEPSENLKPKKETTSPEADKMIVTSDEHTIEIKRNSGQFTPLTKPEKKPVKLADLFKKPEPPKPAEQSQASLQSTQSRKPMMISVARDGKLSQVDVIKLKRLLAEENADLAPKKPKINRLKQLTEQDDPSDLSKSLDKPASVSPTKASPANTRRAGDAPKSTILARTHGPSPFEPESNIELDREVKPEIIRVSVKEKVERELKENKNPFANFINMEETDTSRESTPLPASKPKSRARKIKKLSSPIEDKPQAWTKSPPPPAPEPTDEEEAQSEIETPVETQLASHAAKTESDSLQSPTKAEPNSQSKRTALAKPTAQAKPTALAKPTTQARPTAQAKPAVQDKPASQNKPTTQAKAVTQAKPTAQPNPAAQAKPAVTVSQQRTSPLPKKSSLKKTTRPPPESESELSDEGKVREMKPLGRPPQKLINKKVTISVTSKIDAKIDPDLVPKKVQISLPDHPAWDDTIQPVKKSVKSKSPDLMEEKPASPFLDFALIDDSDDEREREKVKQLEKQKVLKKAHDNLLKNVEIATIPVVEKKPFQPKKRPEQSAEQPQDEMFDDGVMTTSKRKKKIKKLKKKLGAKTSDEIDFDLLFPGDKKISQGPSGNESSKEEADEKVEEISSIAEEKEPTMKDKEVESVPDSIVPENSGTIVNEEEAPKPSENAGKSTHEKESEGKTLIKEECESEPSVLKEESTTPTDDKLTKPSVDVKEKPKTSPELKEDSKQPVDPMKTEPTKPEPMKTEPTKPEPTKTEPIKMKPTKTESMKTKAFVAEEKKGIAESSKKEEDKPNVEILVKKPDEPEDKATSSAKETIERPADHPALTVEADKTNTDPKPGLSDKSKNTQLKTSKMVPPLKPSTQKENPTSQPLPDQTAELAPKPVKSKPIQLDPEPSTKDISQPIPDIKKVPYKHQSRAAFLTTSKETGKVKPKAEPIKTTMVNSLRKPRAALYQRNSPDVDVPVIKFGYRYVSPADSAKERRAVMSREKSNVSQPSSLVKDGSKPKSTIKESEDKSKSRTPAKPTQKERSSVGAEKLKTPSTTPRKPAIPTREKSNIVKATPNVREKSILKDPKNPKPSDKKAVHIKADGDKNDDDLADGTGGDQMEEVAPKPETKTEPVAEPITEKPSFFRRFLNIFKSTKPNPMLPAPAEPEVPDPKPEPEQLPEPGKEEIRPDASTDEKDSHSKSAKLSQSKSPSRSRSRSQSRGRSKTPTKGKPETKAPAKKGTTVPRPSRETTRTSMKSRLDKSPFASKSPRTKKKSQIDSKKEEPKSDNEEDVEVAGIKAYISEAKVEPTENSAPEEPAPKPDTKQKTPKRPGKTRLKRPANKTKLPTKSTPTITKPKTNDESLSPDDKSKTNTEVKHELLNADKAEAKVPEAVEKASVDPSSKPSSGKSRFPPIDSASSREGSAQSIRSNTSTVEPLPPIDQQLKDRASPNKDMRNNKTKENVDPERLGSLPSIHSISSNDSGIEADRKHERKSPTMSPITEEIHRALSSGLDKHSKEVAPRNSKTLYGGNYYFGANDDIMAKFLQEVQKEIETVPSKSKKRKNRSPRKVPSPELVPSTKSEDYHVFRMAPHKRITAGGGAIGLSLIPPPNPSSFEPTHHLRKSVSKSKTQRPDSLPTFEFRSLTAEKSESPSITPRLISSADELNLTDGSDVETPRPTKVAWSDEFKEQEEERIVLDTSLALPLEESDHEETNTPPSVYTFPAHSPRKNLNKFMIDIKQSVDESLKTAVQEHNENIERKELARRALQKAVHKRVNYVPPSSFKAMGKKRQIF